ncbi:MAG: hypothetical protein D6808_05010, partial [Candidatus Dadabacteria bacterium]
LTWERAIDSIKSDLLREDLKNITANTLLQKVVDRESHFARAPIPSQARSTLEKVISSIVSILEYELKKRAEAYYSVLDGFYRFFTVIKDEKEALTYSDINRLLLPYKGLREMEYLLSKCGIRISHLLLDEFQDTSLEQWEVLEETALSCIRDKGKSFFCVGDPKQSLYGWRGSTSKLIENISLMDGIKTTNASTTYRCGKEIVKALNGVFGSLSLNGSMKNYRYAAEAWQKRYVSHTTHNKEPSFVVLKRCPDGIEPNRDLPAVLDVMSRDLHHIIKSNPYLSVGILVRRNKAIPDIMKALTSLNLRASEEGGNPLTDSVAVELILAFLRAVEYPEDRISLYHVSNSPLCDILGISNKGESASLKDAFDSVVSRRGLKGTICFLARKLYPYFGRFERKRLQQFIEMTLAFPFSECRLKPFITFVEAERVDSPSLRGIRVMTIHQAKGLEFDCVFLPELDQPLIRYSAYRVMAVRDDPLMPPSYITAFPTKDICRICPDLREKREKFENEIVEQELSALYVAMSRARFGLYMYTTNKRGITFASVLKGGFEKLSQQENSKDNTELLYVSGNPKWWQKISKKGPDGRKTISLRKPVVEKDMPPKRGWKIISPYLEEGGVESTVGFQLDLRNESSLVRGDALHACFEAVEWIDEHFPSFGEIEERLNSAGDRAINADIIEEFLEILSRPKVKYMLSKSFYLNKGLTPIELYREKKFGVILKSGVPVQGVFDRVVILEDSSGERHIEVLDFKSDNLYGRESLDQRIRYYTPQMELYKEAASLFFGINCENVEGILLFLGTKKVEPEAVYVSNRGFREAFR